MPNAMGELSDEEVFGAPSVQPAALAPRMVMPKPGELSDEEVFGAAPAPAAPQPTLGERFVTNAKEALASNPAPAVERYLSMKGGELLSPLLGEDNFLARHSDELMQRRQEIGAEYEAMPSYTEQPTTLGKILHGAAALGGQLAGSAADPSSLLAPGATAVGRIAGNAAVNAGTDVVGQVADMGTGLREEFSPAQTAISAGGGAAFQGLSELFARIATRRGKPAADLTDDEVLEEIAQDPELEAALMEAGYTPEAARAADPEVAQRFLDRRAARQVDEQVSGAFAMKEGPEGTGRRAQRAQDAEIDRQRGIEEGIETGEVDPGLRPTEGQPPPRYSEEPFLVDEMGRASAPGDVGARAGLEANGGVHAMSNDDLDELLIRNGHRMADVRNMPPGQKIRAAERITQDAARQPEGPTMSVRSEQPDAGPGQPAGDFSPVDRPAFSGRPNSARPDPNAADVSRSPNEVPRESFVTGGTGDRPFVDDPRDPNAALWRERAEAKTQAEQDRVAEELSARWDAEDRARQSRWRQNQDASGRAQQRSAGDYAPDPGPRPETGWRVDDDGFLTDPAGKVVRFRTSKEAARWAIRNKLGEDFQRVAAEANGEGVFMRASDRFRSGAADAANARRAADESQAAGAARAAAGESSDLAPAGREMPEAAPRPPQPPPPTPRQPAASPSQPAPRAEPELAPPPVAAAAEDPIPPPPSRPAPAGAEPRAQEPADPAAGLTELERAASARAQIADHISKAERELAKMDPHAAGEPAAKRRAAQDRLDALNRRADEIEADVERLAGDDANAVLAAEDSAAAKLGPKHRATLYSNPIGPAIIAMWDAAKWAGGKIAGMSPGIRDLGAFADEIGRAAKRGDGPGAISSLFSAARRTYDGHMEWLAGHFDSPHLNALLDNFITAPGRGDRAVSKTFDEAIQQRVNPRLKAWQGLVEEARATGLSDDAIADQLAGVKPLTAKGAAVVRKIQAFFAEEHAHATGAGVELGKSKNYFPRIFDVEKVRTDRVQALAALEKVYRAEGLGAEEAKDAALNLWEAVVYGDVATPAMGGASRSVVSSIFKSREFGPKADAILRDFYVRDLDAVGVRYVPAIARRAEVAKRFGDGFSKWKELVKEIRADDPKILGYEKEIASYVATMTGFAAPQMGHGARAVSSWLRTFTTLSLMEKATLSSLVEPLVAGIRTGNLLDSFGTFRETAKQLSGRFKGMAAQDIRDIAIDLGVIAGEGHNALMAARFNAVEELGRRQAKVLSAYFRRTGLEQWTNASRVATMRTGMVFLRRLAHDMAGGGDKARMATFSLRELGIEDAKAFGSMVRGWGDQLPDHGQLFRPEAAAYRNALLRFSDQSILRPTAGTRPRWANHPLGAIAFQLNSYAYAYGRNVLVRQARLAKAAKAGEIPAGLYAQQLLAGALPGFLALALGQYAFGEVRDKIYSIGQDDPAHERMTDAAKVERALDRSGLFTGYSQWMNALSGVRYQNSPLAPVLGPVLGNINQFVTAASKLGVSNSAETNSAERKALTVTYDLLVEPMVNTLLGSFAPGAANASLTTLVLPNLRSKFVDSIAGQDSGRKKQEITSFFEHLAQRWAGMGEGVGGGVAGRPKRPKRPSRN